MDSDKKQQPTNAQLWQAARDAYLLGATLKDISAQYGLSYQALKSRAQRNKWPKPASVGETPPSAALAPPAAVAGRSLAQRGEAHKLRIAELVEQALAAALPPALNSWQDIAIAAKLGNTALGLDAPAQPVVSLNFPASSSTEVSSYIDISTNYSPEATNDLPPLGETPLNLPEVPAP